MSQNSSLVTMFESTEIPADTLALSVNGGTHLEQSQLNEDVARPSLSADVGNDDCSPSKTQQVQQKYAEERRKRLRSDGVDQYINLNSAEDHSFKRFLEDPWDDGSASPICLQDGARFKVVIMGAGYGGLLFAARLLDSDAGFKPEDIVIVDTATGFGGTWYWNRYPGLMCDVESYIYMPLLEETDYVPKHKYAYGEELREHANRIAEHWKIKDRAMFRTELHRCTWREDAAEWALEMTQRLLPTSGQPAQSVTAKVYADFVILVPGLLNRPKLPLLPGLDAFRGQSFLAARWDYRVTGGSPKDQVLNNLRDKRVGIIGTGATAVQIVPELAKWSKQLYVYQRTPASVDVRGQRTTDPDEWAKNVKTGPGWQMARSRNFLSFTSNTQPPAPADMISDGWTSFPSYSVLTGSPRATHVTMDKMGEYVAEMHQLDLPRSQRIRARVDQVVRDEDVAAKLKAWYPGWCKRPAFHDEYLEAFNLPNVTLIDTAGKGIEAITDWGVKANGKIHDLDVLIFSTGFEFGTFGSPASRCGVEVVGRDGKLMDAKWSQSQSQGAITLTLHGICSRDFPNMFFTSSNQAGVASIFTPTLETFAQHAALIISEGLKKLESEATERPDANLKVAIEPTREAEEAWAKRVLAGAASLAPMGGCTPSYFNAEASMDNMTMEEQLKAAATTRWPAGLNDFIDVLQDWRNAGDLSELQISVVEY